MAIEGATGQSVIFEVDPLSGIDVVSARLRFICATEDLPNGAAYTVRVIQSEGTGITTLVLENN